MTNKYTQKDVKAVLKSMVKKGYPTTNARNLIYQIEKDNKIFVIPQHKDKLVKWFHKNKGGF